MRLAASLGLQTWYAEENPLSGEKNAGKLFVIPYVATQTPWVSYGKINRRKKLNHKSKLMWYVSPLNSDLLFIL